MRPRWLVVGLIASLVLNLFLIGAGAGVIALGMRMAHEAAPARQASALFWASEGLPQPARRNMRQMFREVRDQVKPDSDRSLALRAGAWGALGDANPNAGAIEQQLAQSRQIDISVRSRVEQAVVGYAAKMPGPDRQIFADGMRRILTPRAQPAASTAGS